MPTLRSRPPRAPDRSPGRRRPLRAPPPAPAIPEERAFPWHAPAIPDVPLRYLGPPYFDR